MIELNEHTRQILGLPNFRCIPIANRLRELGYKITYKAEDEQATVIHWMLSLYEKYGNNWKDHFLTELQYKPATDKRNTT